MGFDAGEFKRDTSAAFRLCRREWEKQFGPDLDWQQNDIAGYRIWAQLEAITRGMVDYMMAMALLGS